MKQLVYAVILFASFLLWSSCGNKTNTSTASYRDITEAVYASGNLYPENEYKLFANTEGTLLKRFVNAGDTISKGAALFMLDREVDLSRLNTAAEALRVAERNAGANSPLLAEMSAGIRALEDRYKQDSSDYIRYQSLYAKEAVNLKTLEQIKLKYETSRNELIAKKQAIKRTQDQTQVELANAQSNYEAVLQSYQEHAPVSRVNGMVYEVFKEEGESVRRGELLAILGASDSMLVRLQVDELDIRKVKLGQEVIIRFDIDQKQIYKAKITRIYPKLNKADQSFRVEAAFEDQGPVGFYGLTLEANILINTKNHALTISRELLLPGDSILIQEGKEEKKVKIEVGAMDWDFVEVLGGIDESTPLIVR